MRSVFFLSQKMKDKVEKLDRFYFTYLRVFDEEDQRKITKRSNYYKFIHSVATGPLPALGTIFFPYDWIFSIFGQISQVHMIPIYTLVFFASKEVFGQISYRTEIRHKEKIYEKYKEKVALTKDEVLEIEEAIKRDFLRIESEKQKK